MCNKILIEKVLPKGKSTESITHNCGHRGRVGKVAVFQRSLSFDHLTTVSGVGSSPALATCETRQVLLAGVSGGFSEVLPFRHTYRLARLYE